MILYAFTVFIIAVSFILFLNYLVIAVIHRKDKEPCGGQLPVYPKVSVVKPISGADDGAEDNIRSFFTLDYPVYEIVFAVDSEYPFSFELLSRIKREYPAIPAKIISVVRSRKYNPKYAALEEIEKECNGELYWLTDSNVRVERGTLNKLVREYVDKGSKLVFSPIRGTGSGSIGSIMENAFHNSFSSMNILCAWKYFRMPIPLGKSLLIEKNTLAALGGFSAFKEYLSDDLMMGKSYIDHKIRISTNYTWVTNYNSSASISRFWNRVERWSKMRFKMRNRLYYSLEILANPIALSLISLLYLGSKGVPLLVTAVVVKVLYEYCNLFILNTRDAGKTGVLAAYPFCVILKDLITFILFVAPFFSGTVSWRGRRIVIGAESRIMGIKE